MDCSQELDRLLNVICHVHTDLHLIKRSKHTRNNACVSFISKNTHFIGNAHTIVEKKILKRRVFCMPAMVGHIRIVNIGSSGIFHIGDVFAIRPISYSRAFAGAGSFNVGDNVSVYNYQSATTVNDSDVVDQAIIGST